MCKENTAIRLKKIMEERNLRQVDILEMVKPFCEKYGVKMNRSDLSQYCTGKVEPNQRKLYVLANALGVSEAWLMGFDVPKDRVSQEQLEENIEHVENLVKKAKEMDSYKEGLRLDEIELIEKYRTLDQYGKDAVTSVLNAEYDRCQDEEENSVTIDRETAMKMPLELRLKFGKFLTEGTELMVARRKKK